MPAKSPLHQHILDRCRETFGEPSTTLARDDHWSLKPASDVPAINFMVNGTSDQPAIWVFDPHDRMNPVVCFGITSEAYLEEVLGIIRKRVQLAALNPVRHSTSRSNGDGHGAPPPPSPSPQS